MKVDKYNVSAQSGALIWVLVEHGAHRSSFPVKEGYEIKELLETFELNDGAKLMSNFDVVVSCMEKNGCYFGTTNAGCQIPSS